jgi:hypothetical protein
VTIEETKRKIKEIKIKLGNERMKEEEYETIELTLLYVSSLH